MGRRRVTLAVLTAALSAVAAVMTASGALTDPQDRDLHHPAIQGPPGSARPPRNLGGPGTGTGTATIEIDRNARTLCYAITTQNVALPLLAAHIHVAPAGPHAGPVVVLLFGEPVNAAAVPRTCLTGLDKNLLKDILRSPQDYYVNVHTAPFPNGAV